MMIMAERKADHLPDARTENNFEPLDHKQAPIGIATIWNN